MLCLNQKLELKRFLDEVKVQLPSTKAFKTFSKASYIINYKDSLMGSKHTCNCTQGRFLFVPFYTCHDAGIKIHKKNEQDLMLSLKILGHLVFGSLQHFSRRQMNCFLMKIFHLSSRRLLEF